MSGAVDMCVAESLIWEQSAFWYLAGLEDGKHHRRQPFPHGPTTTLGKQFIRAYADACRSKPSWPYLPDFYQDWRKRAGV